jgi:capsular exopolysaccharide synthesis family protein
VSAFTDERREGSRYLDALRQHWRLIAVLVVIAVAVAGLYSVTAAKRYEASADLLVSPISADDDTFIGIDVLRQSGDPTRSVVTAARLVKTQDVAAGVKARLGLEHSNPLARVEVKPVGQANIVTIVGKGGTPEEASTIANAFADETIAKQKAKFQSELGTAVAGLRRRLDAIQRVRPDSIEALTLQERLAVLNSLLGSEDPTLSILNRATPPSTPAWPKPKLSIAVAMLTALLLGTGLAVSLELINPRVSREDELLFAQRLPILARVPRLRQHEVRGYLAGRGRLPAEAWEAYRTLRANLASGVDEAGMPRTILVTSAIPGEGKTLTAVNLAITLASGGMRVVLVDGDLRRPMLATVFGLASPGSGFADLFVRDTHDDRILIPAGDREKMLRLVLATPERAHLVDMLQMRRVTRALNWLKHRADVVVIDSPALTEVADALTLADAVDAVVIAVRLGHTRRDMLHELRRVLAQRGVAPLGFVVTTRERPGRQPYGYDSTEAVENEFVAGVVGPIDPLAENKQLHSA